MRNRLSPAAAMSLNRGCEVRPSKRKGGWVFWTEGAEAGAGPPGKREQQHPLFQFIFYTNNKTTVYSCSLSHIFIEDGIHSYCSSAAEIPQNQSFH